MKRIFLLLFLISFFESCSNKSVQLPETDNSDITEIKDVSPAYLFYDETKKNSIELNRKNLIISTNWLVNVDKRLTLNQAIPSIIFLQNKKRNAKMHKNEVAKNYFTCSNPDIQNLVFIEFTDVVYHDEPLDDYLSNLSSKSNSKHVISIGFGLNDDITIINSNSKEALYKTDIEFLKSHFNELDTLNNIIYLNFHEDLSFQNYITFKSLLMKLDLRQASISNQEFIHN